MRLFGVSDAAATFVVAGLALASLLYSPSTATGRNAAATEFTIVGDRIVGGVRIGATLNHARSVLGMPDVQRRVSNYECRAGWRTIGVALTFLDLSNANPCGHGALVRATAASASWRTGRGLRVGDPVGRVRRLYRTARFHRLGYRGWWLIARRTCPTTGSQPYPGLLARITTQRRVAALVVTLAACE
jgi:hypothetical protein